MTDSKNEVKSNIVVFADGSAIDFKASGKVRVAYGVKESSITFKTALAEVITYVVEGIEALTPFQQEVYLYGVSEKIKTTLAPVALPDLAAKIELEIEAIKKGEFVTRSAGVVSGTLDNFLKAFAMVNGTGNVDTGSVQFPVPASALINGEVIAKWDDIARADVVADVLAFWNALSPEAKRLQRRNTFLTTQASYL